MARQCQRVAAQFGHRDRFPVTRPQHRPDVMHARHLAAVRADRVVLLVHFDADVQRVRSQVAFVAQLGDEGGLRQAIDVVVRAGA